MPKQSKSSTAPKTGRWLRDKIYRVSLKGRYTQLKRAAKKGGLLITLSLEEFALLAQAPCGYCGKEVPKGYTGYWIDQIEAGKGYTMQNSLSCCPSCNRIKGDEFDQAQMKSLARLIKRIRAKEIKRKK